MATSANFDLKVVSVLGGYRPSRRDTFTGSLFVLEISLIIPRAGSATGASPAAALAIRCQRFVCLKPGWGGQDSGCPALTCDRSQRSGAVVSGQSSISPKR